jgi:3-phosphoshikimate 1-carboxyvinyltransferase
VPLPGIIEIVPLDKPVTAEITVPGSKSITNRALVLAALAKGETTLHGALWSEDTQVMVEALRALGFALEVGPDPLEFCNRTIKVRGQGGSIPRAGTETKPLELMVGNAGTAARFLAPLVCLGNGVYRLSGVPRMHERPQGALFKALRELGYRVESANEKLPALIYGTGPRQGKCVVSIEESSQFASGLLLAATVGGWDVRTIGENEEESPYVALTTKLIAAFPSEGGAFQIEPDASSGSYFIAAERFVKQPDYLEYSGQFGVEVPTRRLNTVQVAHWPETGWQMDERFPAMIANAAALSAGLELERRGERENHANVDLAQHLPSWQISRRDDLGDSIMTAIMMAPFSLAVGRFTDLGRLRLQECERVVALLTELTKCGAKVIEKGDTLEIFPSKLHGAEIESYDDHRMAMCFAVLGLKVPGMRIKNPACVKKTFPNFFQKLAGEPPHGLGVRILDGTTGRELGLQELFAE